METTRSDQNQRPFLAALEAARRFEPGAQQGAGEGHCGRTKLTRGNPLQPWLVASGAS